MAKEFNRISLPESITYNGEVYTLDARVSAKASIDRTSMNAVQRDLKTKGIKMVVVNVLSKNLRCRTDLYGRAYNVQKHIFTNIKK